MLYFILIIKENYKTPTAANDQPPELKKCHFMGNHIYSMGLTFLPIDEFNVFNI